MIRLTGNAIQVCTSPVFTHPVHSGTSHTAYVFNHNLGSLVDVIKMFSDTDGDTIRNDFYNDGTNFGGYTHNASSAASITLRLYRLAGASIDVYIKGFILSS